MARDLPALIIAFRRLDGVQRLMKSLQEAGVVRVFLTIDGPRTPEDLELQITIERWATEFASDFDLELLCLRRDSNLGVGKGIVESIDWFFSQVEFGLVLEDDLEISDDFVNYVDYCREKFGNHKDLWMISGDQFFPELFDGTQFGTCNYPLVWGWATWSTKWQEMRAAIVGRHRLNFRYLFSPIYSFWWAGARRVELGLIDTWDIPLALEMRLQGKLTITPPTNLVRNLGFDKFASHTKNDLFPMNTKISRVIGKFTEVSLLEDKLSLSRSNKKLEGEVFKIRVRHLLSPLKLCIHRIFQR